MALPSCGWGTQMDGGSHVTTFKWRTGEGQPLRIPTSAHAGWPVHVQTAAENVTATKMMKCCAKTAVFLLKSLISQFYSWDLEIQAVHKNMVTTRLGNSSATGYLKHEGKFPPFSALFQVLIRYRSPSLGRWSKTLYLHLAEISENRTSKICSYLSEKGPTGTYFAPDNLDNYSRDGKGKDIKKEHGGERKRREKSNSCTLSFYTGYFENVRKINFLMGDVYLVPAKAQCLPTLGDRAFQSETPQWHSLLVEIRNTLSLTSFKRAL